MKLPEQLAKRFHTPQLTRGRMILAVVVAVGADGVQLLLGPLGWAFVDEAIDLVALALTTWALGFHLLLLPTFAVELVPVADLLPTWTGCVIAVIALRKREQRATPQVTAPPPKPDPQPPALD